MKTKLEIIDETVQAYSDPGNRAKGSNGNCLYLTPDGRMCAVGRCMLPEKLNLLCDELDVPLKLLYILEEGASLDDFLKPEYRGHGLSFWSDLQVLHDQISNWGSGGLTELGRRMVIDLKDRYAPDSPLEE